MTDRFRDRLSEYLDGELEAADVALVERHLETCDECAEILVDLEAVRRHAAELTNREPETDLWTGIAARITAKDAASRRPVATSDQRAVSPRGRRSARRLTFTVPQLAAAAVALASVSVTGAWMTWGADGGDPSAAAAEVPATGAAFVSSAEDGATLAEQYGSVIDELESALFGADLHPETEASLRRALLKIDRAIEDARRALEELPGDPYLEQHVESTMRRKTDFLRRAVRMSQG